MSNKKIILIVCIVIALAATTVFASTIVEQIANNTVTEIAIDNVNEQSIATFVEARIKNNDGIKSPEQFKSIIDCCHRAKYENVAAYVSFVCENRFTASQIKTINKILENGTTIQSLNQVYNFWLTTDEPFSLVEDICKHENEYFSEYWYEDVFNYLTDNKHGVLSDEDVRAYVNDGISTDIILTANVLSRKDGQNINDILDRVKKGESIDDIICEIYNVNQLPDVETSFEKVNKLIKTQKYNVSKTIVNSDKINTFIDTLENEYGGIILDKIFDETQRLKISVPETDEEADIEDLKKCGLPISSIRALLNKGYTPQEISKIPTFDDILPHQSAKKAREVLKNE